MSVRSYLAPFEDLLGPGICKAAPAMFYLSGSYVAKSEPENRLSNFPLWKSGLKNAPQIGGHAQVEGEEG